jgi:heme/copper-type cytochrome/quinol oxidase subunit 2
MIKKVLSTVIAALMVLGLSATAHAATCEACPSVLHCEAEIEGTGYDWKWTFGAGHYTTLPANGLSYRKVNCTDEGNVAGYVRVYTSLWVTDPWSSYCQYGTA